MFKRNDNKLDALNRQIGALRQQLGPNPDETDLDQPTDMASTGRQDAATAQAFSPDDSISYDDGAADDEQEFVTDMSSPAVPSAPDMAATPLVDAQTSVVAHDTVLKGDVVSDGTIHVHGRVEGTVKAKLDVFIAEEANVEATITAANVVIAGYVKGAIRCGSRFEVLPQGRVDGEIQSPSLVVHEGAAIVGQFRMGAGDGTETEKPSVIQRRPTRGSA